MCGHSGADRYAVGRGVVGGPRMSGGGLGWITAGGGTPGRLINEPGVTGYSKSVKGKDGIVAEVRRQVKVGADWIKVHVSGVVPRYAHLGEQCSWTQEELDLICELAHDLGVPVMGHCRGSLSTYRAAKAGIDLIFHGTGMDERALALVMDRKIPVCPAFTFQANMVDYGPLLGTDPDRLSLFEAEIKESVDHLR